MAKFAAGSSYDMTYVAEQEFGVTPPNPQMKRLRVTSSSLGLSKDSFQSNELRKDAQISDLRHGTYQVGGDIGIEFSFAEFDSFVAAAVRGEWKDNPDIAGQQYLVAGILDPSFTIVQEYLNIAELEAFTGVKVNTLSLSIPMNAMVTGTLSLLGRDNEFIAAHPDPSPDESATFSPFDGIKGQLLEGGALIAYVTAVELNITNNMEAEFVLFDKGAAQITPGRNNITGTLSLKFVNTDMLKKFRDEVESSLVITLGDGQRGSYTITLPRIKYTGGDKPVDGEGSIALSMPFQALLDPCTGTNIRVDRIPGPAAAPCVLTYDDDELHESSITPDTIVTVITAEISGGEQAKTFNGVIGQQVPGVTWTGVPTGLIGSAVKKSATEVEITLTGTADAPIDASTTVTVSFSATSFQQGFCHCPGDAITDRTKTLTIVPA